MTDRNTTRRRFLALTASTGLAAVAGCTGGDGGGGGSDDTETAMDDTTTTGMDDTMTEGGMNETSMDDTTTKEEMDDMTETTTEGMAGSSTLSFDFATLQPLATGHYEGWAIFGDEKLSTGTFAAGGKTTFQVDRDLTEADEIVVTIEPEGDMDSMPSGVPVLAGAVEGSTASLSFPVSFDMAGGSYILATPTDGGNSHETSGVWFLDPAGGPSASLSLPELPGGWTYEGWVVHGGQPVSTGRFDDPAAADDFDGHSGSMGAPAFPGEDLLTNAPMGLSFPTDLADGESNVVVSVEPDIDGTDPTGPKPFQVKPLAGKIPMDATDHQSYALQRNTGTLPSGTASIM